MLTVVDSMDPVGPRDWREAAAIACSGIFKNAEKLAVHLVPPMGAGRLSPSESEENLAFLLDCLELVDNHFEGMVNSSNLMLNLDNIYWASEWMILGSLSAAVGYANSRLGEFDNFGQESMTSILCRKQSDYGHSNISRFGRQGLLVRTHDKIARLKNLSLKKINPENESIVDTYVDMVGYSAIGVMWERGWFTLDLIN